MKRSIKHLPKRTQEELNKIIELVTHHIKGCEMILLFGSYARGNYVLWDEKVEFGVNTSYQSDLDILVVISKSNIRDAENRIREKVEYKYEGEFGHRRHALVRCIVEYAGTLNKNLEKRQYFFTEIVKDGIKMYDTKKIKLAKPRELSFSEIKEIAMNEFEIHYPDGVDYLYGENSFLERENYRAGSFLLHQTCERFYNAISLVFTNYRPKCHKLKELGAGVKDFSRELSEVFPLNTDFEKNCYDLLCRAYIEARYNKDFVVTKEELEYMIQRAEILKEITYRICHERFDYYDHRMNE